jgi:hypothetical protein
MRISSTDELIAFLREHYTKLTDKQYCEIMENTLQVYEHSKPADLETLLNRIQTHGAFIDQLPADYEAPLFLIVDYEADVQP